MIERLVRVQQNEKRPNSVFLITLPKVLSNVLELSKGSLISCSLAKLPDSDVPVIVLKKAEIH